jgi:hypothetical protein
MIKDLLSALAKSTKLAVSIYAIKTIIVGYDIALRFHLLTFSLN